MDIVNKNYQEVQLKMKIPRSLAKKTNSVKGGQFCACWQILQSLSQLQNRGFSGALIATFV